MIVKDEKSFANFAWDFKKLGEISEAQNFFCFESNLGKTLYCKRFQFPSLFEVEKHDATNIIKSFLENFEMEYQISRSIPSKYMLKFQKVIVSYPHALFLHEPIENTLKYLIEKNSLDYKQKLILMKEITKGLKDLHDQNICIRSLQTAHILIISQTLDDKFSIVFSESRNCIQLSKKQNSHKIKTPVKELNDFSAPQLIQHRQYDLSCDIWSLGMIFFQILFGKQFKRHYLQQDGLLANPDKTKPQWATNFLEHMLCPKAKHRTNVGDILRMLENALLCSQIVGKYYS